MSAIVDERVSDEVEALEAIMMDDVVIKRKDGVPYAIETVVHPSTGDDADLQYVCVTLEVKLTEGYPDKCPDVFLRNPRGLDDCTMNLIKHQIDEKLRDCLGQPVVFELIEVIRENLTESNLPSGQCAICLYGFTDGDIFIKTQCYHYFHSHCLASHLIAGERYFKEEMDKLPVWQQIEATPFHQTCPVCRSLVSCDVDALKKAPPPVESISAPPFRLTAELKALQLKMAALLAEQVAKGGVVTVGDSGPPPLTITTASDYEEEATSQSPSTPQQTKSESITNGSQGTFGTNNGTYGTNNGAYGTNNGQHSNPVTAGEPTSPSHRSTAYRQPYRGFNRRGKPGRRHPR